MENGKKGKQIEKKKVKESREIKKGETEIKEKIESKKEETK